ncbi:MAG: pirin family protein [Anaerolineaceae bacterium]|nr:pirin family protein [Anaerolineaceae bacterium]
MNKLREIKQLIEPQMVLEGAGVRLLRSFGPHTSNLYDPFLLFDHFAFNDPKEGPIAGFPTHPHRGIETVTYMLSGKVRHRDSLGNSGEITAGDVQWMTAGRGILHEEMPRRGEDNTIYGFQLWVNLPAAQKMGTPRYQEVKEAQIPQHIKDGNTIRVIAGEIDGVQGPVNEIAAQPLYMDVSMSPNSTFEHAVPSDHTCMAYVFSGSGKSASQELHSPQMIIFEDGESVSFETQSEPMRFILIAGAPFNEPIVPYGPFVMNTREEIMQALDDLKKGTFVQDSQI